jgi:polyphosphate kinase
VSQPDGPVLRDRYINREWSWLAFNERVLEEAEDENNPLLERVKFIAIFASNLDEFYMKRVAALCEVIDEGEKKPDSFGYFPEEAYRGIETIAARLRVRHHEVFHHHLQRELEAERIHLVEVAQFDERSRTAVQTYFDTTVYPLVTPMAVDQSHPFPILPSKTLSLAVQLERAGEPALAIMPVPVALPRLIKLPSQPGEHQFVLLEDALRANLERFFRGFDVKESAVFRVMRDSELNIDEEDVSDLLEAVEQQVRGRPRAKPVALEIEKTVSPGLLEQVTERVAVAADRVKLIDGRVDLTFLYELIAKVPRPDLQDPPYRAGRLEYDDIFARIRESDIMVHVPYQSFQPVIDLVDRAADDPDVLGVKITLYRTYQQSAVVQALERAALNGKQVTVLVEIKASFDEERNIRWARQLERAGCHVVYGIPGMKIHSKLCLVIRREEEGIRRYVHLGTGNYNEATARVYTDLHLLTCSEAFGRDASDVFNVISGHSMPPRWNKLVCAPYDLRDCFFQLIDAEIQNQRRTGTGFIFAKLNALQDRKIVDKLYEAGAAGVRMQLLVRGICCLRPGIKGLSETISVRSIVGRFLEHSRIYLFGNGGDPKVFLSSSDWMKRNMERRIELLFPVDKPEFRQELTSLLELFWRDSVKARIMMSDGTYRRTPAARPPFNVQEKFTRRYAQRD